MTVLEKAQGRFGLSINGVQLPPEVIFADGFESGGFVVWSSQVP